MLRFSGSTQHSLMDSQLQLITDWMSTAHLGLKELTIDNHNITNLPVILRLESLTITNCNIFPLNRLDVTAYSHLRYLKLSSINSIEDVSSLDGIYELHLKNCHGIRDISCLNHNSKIFIEKCDNIIDYSNCFRHCKIIDIREPSNVAGESINGFNLLKALEVREIYFYGGKCTKTLFLPQSLSLRSVILENLRSKPPFTLPTEHQIREITVTNCEWVELNFDGIPFVKLVDLKISTLEGLGNGNRVVEVNSCHFIKDFSVLKHCEKVIICECDGFRNINQVRGVKHLIFSPENVNKLPEDMEGVTSLIFHSAPYTLLSLEFPSTLKKLVISSDSLNLMEKLPRLLTRLPHHIGKIVVSVDEHDFRILLQEGELSFPGYIIEFKKGVHFLRKLD